MHHTDHDLRSLFTGIAQRVGVSPIARTLEIVDRTPGMVSFACGNPATEALPVDAIARAAENALRNDPVRALQYVRPRGILQDALVDYLGRDGIAVDQAQLLPTTGAIQALSLLAHALIEPGDLVITEAPTYPVNLATFKAHGARTVGVPMDADGMRVDILARLLERSDVPRPKVIYVIPDAQNPTGITMSPERRRELVRVAGRHGILVVEDVPYRGVVYEGATHPTVYELATASGAPAVLVGSFAKVVAPGLRVGFMVARPELIDTCVLIKQGEDFCTSGFAQLIIEELILDNVIPRTIDTMRSLQQPKLRAMLGALDREMGSIDGACWTEPVGGLFVWLTLPPQIDTDELLERCLGERVAFIPGRYFYPEEVADGEGGLLARAAPRHELRLNFSDPPLTAIPAGIAALARTVRSLMASGA